MNYRLVLLQEGQAKNVDLTKSELIVGRLSECEIQLISNMVSRKHARIYLQAGDYYVEDLGSGNGTFLNGQKIAVAQKLRPNDRLKFGPVLARFEADDPVLQQQLSVPKPVLDGLPLADVQIQEDGDNPSSTILSAIESQGGFSLESRPQEKLKALLELSRTLAGTIELEQLPPRVLETLFKVFPSADRGCILLKDDRTGKMVPKSSRRRREGDDSSVKLSRTIVSTVLTTKKGILSADAASDVRFDASESISALTIRSMMCVPMLDLSGEPIGIINIDTQNPLAQFKNDDLEILLTVAGQAAISYSTAKLMHSYVQKQKQDREMDIARDVQHALLPETLPSENDYQFFASYDSAQAVGGDYYDILTAPDGRIWLAFGDVAGKGVPASLVMSRMSSIVRSVSEFVTDASEAVSRINNHMCARAVEGRFVTFVLVILDLKAHELTLVNAGHMPPMIRNKAREIEEIGAEEAGLPIGVIEDYEFTAVQHVIAAGESLIIYTDGVSEAMNPAGDLFTTERLKEVVKTGPAAAAELGVLIREQVRKFANGREQNDDITLMVFGRNDE